MRKKISLLVSFLLGVLFLTSACSTVTKTTLKIPDSIQDIANPIASNLIASLDKQDYQGFIRDFDDAMQKAMTQQAFTEIRKLIWGQYGNYQSMAFQQAVDQQGYIGVFYTLYFEKGDVTMNLVLTPQSPYKLSGLWFPPK
jgi:hypothetical protein